MNNLLRILPVPAQPPADDAAPLAVDARGLAALLSCGLRTIRRWNSSGKLPRPVKVGGRLLWIVEEIKAWLAVGTPDCSAWEQIKQTRRAK